VGTASPAAPAWNCQMPLRLSQLERTICGRGYSGSGLCVSTWLAHEVIKSACFICQAWALVAATRLCRGQKQRPPPATRCWPDAASESQTMKRVRPLRTHRDARRRTQTPPKELPPPERRHKGVPSQSGDRHPSWSEPAGPGSRASPSRGHSCPHAKSGGVPCETPPNNRSNPADACGRSAVPATDCLLFRYG
jgi:hypothetical protein